MFWHTHNKYRVTMGLLVLSWCFLYLNQTLLPGAVLKLWSALLVIVISPAATATFAHAALLTGHFMPGPRRFCLNAALVAGQFTITIDQILAHIPLPVFAWAYAAHSYEFSVILQELHKDEEALAVLEKCLPIVERAEGASSTAVLDVLVLMASAQRDLGRYDECIRTAGRAKEIANKAPGTALTAAVLLADICVAYSKRGRYTEAMQLGEKAVDILMNLPWEDVPYGREGLTAIALNNLACVYDDCCQYERAGQLYERALKLKIQCMPAGSKSIGIAHSNMANILNEQGKHEEAVPEAQLAMQILEAVGEKDSVNWAEALRNLGDACRGLARLEESEKHLLDAMALTEKLLPCDNLDWANAYLAMAKFYRDKGTLPQAREYFKRTIDLLESAMGKNHPKVVEVVSEYTKLDSHIYEPSPAVERVATSKSC